MFVIFQSFTQSQWLTGRVAKQLHSFFPKHTYLGPISIDWLGNLRVQDFEFLVDDIPLISANRITCRFNLLSLLLGKIEIQKIHAHHLHLRFVRDSSSQSLWFQVQVNASQSNESENILKISNGKIKVDSLDLLIQTPDREFFDFHSLTIQDCDFLLKDDSLSLKGHSFSEKIDPIQFQIYTGEDELSVQLEANNLTWTEALAQSLPKSARQVIQSFHPKGTVHSLLTLEKGKGDPHPEAQFTVSPLSLTLTPQYFQMPFSILEGNLTYDSEEDCLEITDAAFDSPLLTGQANWTNSDGTIDCVIQQTQNDFSGLPRRLSRFLNWVQPQDSFSCRLKSHRNGFSVEAQIENLSLDGIRPQLSHLTGRVTFDSPIHHPIQGKAILSSLQILNLEFDHAIIPFKDRNGILIGEDKDFSLKGPWVEAQGKLRGHNGTVSGKIIIKNLDLAKWAAKTNFIESLGDFRGTFNGVLNLNASKSATSNQILGTLSFKIKDGFYEVANNLLPLAHILTTLQNAVILDMFKGKDHQLNKQRVTEAKGEIDIFSDHMSIRAKLEGYPLEFEVVGDIDYNQNGQLEITPSPFSKLPIDPAKLILNFVPIKVKWENGKLVEK